MKEVQLFIWNVFWGIIGLSSISAIINLSVEDNQAIERWRAKKEGVISCGYNQSTNGFIFFYTESRKERIKKSCIGSSIKTDAGHSKESREGNGCSHQSSAGTLLAVAPNRKQHNACTHT